MSELKDDKDEAAAKAKSLKSLKQKALNQGIGAQAPGGGYERHVFFCTGGSCGGKNAKDALKSLRKQLKSLSAEGHPVRCTPVDCLQICRNGPIAVIYPEGTWYHHADEAVCARIANEHLRNGVPVEEFIFAENPLTPSTPEDPTVPAS